ncbi:hypothetical protein DD594_25600, partial [Enterobacter cloacae complex sp. 4DZ1-17B1]|uniref:DUF4219 domain-containing protein n=1 Tax=Enterobacter cloacae complex sp. 4DZ1-17B1 TaxID=2511991 RepID=UPI0010256183
MAQSTEKEIFGAFTSEDKLDGTNYSLWSFMAKNVLVGKGLWDYVSGDEVRPGSIAPATPGCGAVVGAGPSQVTPEQKKWDTKDAQAMAVIALTIKRTITPH